MFYLLAHGGTSACNGNVVSGLGETKAAAIWYNAVTNYLKSGDNYHDARQAAIDSANELYGAGSLESNTVAAAYAARIAGNPPFVDGDKRVAAHAAVLFALVNGFECRATPDELVAITLDVAKGDVEVEALAIWFRQRLQPA